eukprot:scpid106750/ scgid26469/ 
MKRTHTNETRKDGDKHTSTQMGSGKKEKKEGKERKNRMNFLKSVVIALLVVLALANAASFNAKFNFKTSLDDVRKERERAIVDACTENADEFCGGFPEELDDFVTVLPCLYDHATELTEDCKEALGLNPKAN